MDVEVSNSSTSSNLVPTTKRRCTCCTKLNSIDIKRPSCKFMKNTCVVIGILIGVISFILVICVIAFDEDELVDISLCHDYEQNIRIYTELASMCYDLTEKLSLTQRECEYLDVISDVYLQRVTLILDNHNWSECPTQSYN